MRPTKIIYSVAAMVGAGVLAVGCGSATDCGDGAGCTSDAGVDSGPGVDTASDSPALFGLSPGDYCYDIVSIAAGFNDGCQIGVDSAELVGKAALPGKYDATTGTLTLGTAGSLGAGPIRSNMGTLTRENTATDPMMATCSWHQTDTTMVVLTATNEFTASVTEVENMFVAACNPIPTGGTCTSTWTWSMKINGAKTAPDCK